MERKEGASHTRAVKANVPQYISSVRYEALLMETALHQALYKATAHVF